MDGNADSLETVAARLGEAPTRGDLAQLRDEILAAAKRDFRQVEALTGLYALFPVRAPVPPSRGWAASPDLLLYLTSVVVTRRPRVVVELGSGLSTMWLGYAMEKSGHSGRIVSLDHERGFAERTRSLLQGHGLAERAEVRYAPLID